MWAFTTAARSAGRLLRRHGLILLPRNASLALPPMPMKQMILKPSMGLRNYAVVRDATATLSESIQPTEVTSIEELISQHKSEMSKLRQELLDPDRSPASETEMLWEYLLVTTKLENLRDARYLEKLRAERRALEQKSEESCSEDVGDKNDDDVKEDGGESRNEVASVDDGTEEEMQNDYENHLMHDPQEQQTRKALSAVQKGGTVLNKAHYEIWDWLCAHRSDPHIPAEFRQMMEQHSHALGTDLAHITPRVVEEVADKLGGRAY